MRICDNPKKMKKPNYYKEAFSETLNFILLTVIAVTVVAGLKFMPLFIALEIIYMITIPNLPFYKNYTNLKKGYTKDSPVLNPGKERHIDSALPFEIKNKCEKLEMKYNEIIKISGRNQDLQVMMADELQKLEYLLDKYISFSANLANYKEYLQNNNPETISAEISNIKSRIKTCFDGIKVVNDLDMIHKRLQKKTLLQDNLTILQKRFDKIRHMKGITETLQAELDVIEDTFYLISDHIASFTPGDTLDINISNIIHSVENTEKVVKDTRQEMDKIKNLNMNRLME
jgi:hypothetical protein